MQLGPVELGLEHLGDLVPCFLLDDHLVDAGAQLQRAVPELAHLLLGRHVAVARDHRIEIELQHRVERGRPFLRAAAARIVDQLRRCIAVGEHVARRECPARRKEGDDVAVGVGAPEVIEIHACRRVHAGMVVEHHFGRPARLPSTMPPRACTEANLHVQLLQLRIAAAVIT
jgi:hypothetical protein